MMIYHHLEGMAQDYNTSIVIALEILQSCIKSSIWSPIQSTSCSWCSSSSSLFSSFSIKDRSIIDYFSIDDRLFVYTLVIDQVSPSMTLYRNLYQKLIDRSSLDRKFLSCWSIMAHLSSNDYRLSYVGRSSSIDRHPSSSTYLIDNNRTIINIGIDHQSTDHWSSYMERSSMVIWRSFYQHNQSDTCG